MTQDIDFGLWEWELLDYLGGEIHDLLVASLRTNGRKDRT